MFADVFRTMTTVMEHSVLTPPKPIEEVQQDIPVREEEEERLRELEEQKQAEEKARVRLV
jgi:membrane protein involved in colicin uptake